MPTYLLTNEVISANLWKMLETNPAYSQDLTTKAKVGKSAVCTYFQFIPATTNSTAGDFPDISLAKKGWRTDSPINGKISAGTWTFKVAIYNDTRYGFRIKVAVRISKSANADGSNATLIDVSESPNVLTLPATAGSIVTDSWTYSGSDIAFSNEYLFVEFRLHIEASATNSTAQCTFICDEDPSVREESVTVPTIIPPPAVTTHDATNIGDTYATLNGETNFDCTERGFEWGTQSGNYPNSWTETGSFPAGTFSHQITGLSADTPYYFRAKAYSPSTGWLYGSELSFETTHIPVGLDSTDRIAPLYVFYAVGRFWIFYIITTTVYYRTSTDGSTWSDRTSVTDVIDWTIQEAHVPEVFAIYFDGTYFHYAVLKSDYKLYYRRGTPNSDGTITWHTSTEQLVDTGDSTLLLQVSDIAKDSNGYVWIAVDVFHQLGWNAYVYKNSRTDEYWTTDTDFPYSLGSARRNTHPIVLPLTGGKVYFIYSQTCPSPTYYTIPYGILWDGSWGSAETGFFAYCSTDGFCIGAIAVGDDIYAVETDIANSKIKFNKRTYGVGWGTEVEVVDVPPAGVQPRLVYTPSAIYCFWENLNDNKIYYKKYVNGSWDAQATVYADESTYGLTSYFTIALFRKNYNSYVGEAHMVYTSTPYGIKFSYFTVVLVTKTIVAFEFPMSYLPKPVSSLELRSKVEGATITDIAKDFPIVVKEKGKQNELTSQFE